MSDELRRRDAEHSLFPLMSTSSEFGIIITDAAGLTAWVNASFERMCGYTLAELLGKKPGEILQGPGTDKAAVARIHAAVASNEPITVELLNYRKDGTPYWVSLHITPLLQSSGQVAGFAAMALDITERKRDEEQLMLLQAAVTQADDAIMITDARLDAPGPSIVFVNPALTRMTGYSAEELIGNNPRLLQGPKTERAVLDQLRHALSTGGRFHGRAVNYRKDGSEFLLEWHITPIRRQDQVITHYVAVQRDVTEQVQAETTLRMSEERFRQQYKGIPIPTYTWQRRGDDFVLIDYNDAANEFTQGQIRPFVGINASRLFDDEPEIRADFERCYQDHATLKREIEYRFRSTGETRDLAVTYVFIPPDLIMLHTEDLTERRQLSAQLLQAQRLESVGRLAGGVAHDFNNLLTAIGGFADLAAMLLPSETPAQDELREITKVVRKGAELTHQLLAFARKQVLLAQTVELNTLLDQLSHLLRRLLPETISLEFRPTADLWATIADPGQIEQVVVNLVVNARDAMPRGGTISITTANVTVDRAFAVTQRNLSAGDYVVVAVRDTGIGMPAAVQAEAFDPFFTTKAPADGTGLGLAISYGIVTQHGGAIRLDSAEGQGTTVTVYLPRASEHIERQATEPKETCPGGTETLLVVEDDALVRGLAARLLRAHGYTVLEAANGNEALSVVQTNRDRPIHLLLTDVVMPQMPGQQVADMLRRECAGLKVLYMSGYPHHEFLDDESLERSTAWLAKPFTVDSLIRAVYDCLTAPGAEER